MISNRNLFFQESVFSFQPHHGFSRVILQFQQLDAYPTHRATLMGPWLLLSRARYLVTNIHRGAPNNLGASKGHHAHYAPYLVGLEIVKGNPSNS